MAKRDKHQVVPSGMLSKEFLNQFKAEQDVSIHIPEHTRSLSGSL